MIALVKNKIQEIQDVCEKHHVLSLYLFGSAIDEISFDQQSDIDFLYEIDLIKFDWNGNDYDYIDNLNDLETGLNNVLSRKVDLIPYKNIHNSYFKKIADASKQLIYAGR